MKLKICSKCKKEYPNNKNYFNKDKNQKDGRSYYCKWCQNILRKQSYNRTYNTERNTSKTQLIRARRFANGTCIDCTSPRMENNNYCEKHYLQQLSNTRFKTIKYWIHIKEKLEKQNYTCPYSGRKLILGENASIDHIKPAYLHPDLTEDMDNIHIVDKQANYAKHKLTETDFFKLIEDIYNHSIKNK